MIGRAEWVAWQASVDGFAHASGLAALFLERHVNECSV